MQTAIVIFVVLASVAYTVRQLFKTVRAGNGKAGSCCAHGCEGQAKAQQAQQSAQTTSPRTQFIDADLLRRPRKN